MPAEMVVGLLNRVYSAFDAVCEFHGAEKIKTVGDAYMFAAGLPTQREDHLEVAMQAAMDMVGVLAQIPTRHGGRLQVRIGIASGPVIAGVIGTSKFAYDVWGDTVNQASRMESEGVGGRIQVTEAIHETLRDRLDFDDRGCIDMKGLGATRAYLVAEDASALLPSAVQSVVAASRERRGITRSLSQAPELEGMAKVGAVSAQTGGADLREVALEGLSAHGPLATCAVDSAHTDP
jgi:class 3 adenylate cyclase